jgi:hypothetical protein
VISDLGFTASAQLWNASRQATPSHPAPMPSVIGTERQWPRAQSPRQCFRGSGAAATPPWQHRRGGAADAALPLRRCHGDIVSAALPMRRSRGDAPEATRRCRGGAAEATLPRRPPCLGSRCFRGACNYEGEKLRPRRVHGEHGARRAATEHKTSTNQVLPPLHLCGLLSAHFFKLRQKKRSAGFARFGGLGRNLVTSLPHHLNERDL